MDTAFKIELLQTSEHDRSQFDCGNEQLNHFIRHQASQEQKRQICAIYVLMNNSQIVGYYTLSSTSLLGQDLPHEFVNKLPRYPVLPATLLGRLAVDVHYQGKGLGKYLLFDALKRAYEKSRDVGSVAVVIDAKNEKLQQFYMSLGFVCLKDEHLTLFYPMQKIKKLI